MNMKTYFYNVMECFLYALQYLREQSHVIHLVLNISHNNFIFCYLLNTLLYTYFIYLKIYEFN